MIAVGLMSGTSLDGIDAALVDIRPRGEGYHLETLRFASYPFQAGLEGALRAALPPADGTVRGAAELHRALGLAFGDAARAIAADAGIDYVASHGQTVWHDGDASTTLQLGDAFVIRETARATVCYDFRSADCAAGGHGAPLVPHVDVLLFGTQSEDRVALNVGGIANVTLLPRSGEATAYDTGPGNMLIDAFVRARTGGAERFDRDGRHAARGSADERALEAMLTDEYFARRPPKTSGRERFGTGFLERHRERLAALSLEEGCATLAELTAATVAKAVDDAGLPSAHVIVSGGGAANASLMARLRARLPLALVESSDAMGVPSDAKEAIAFAVLGYETLRERAANVPGATGAGRRAVLGAIAPYRLRSLLERVDAECATA